MASRKQDTVFARRRINEEGKLETAQTETLEKKLGIREAEKGERESHSLFPFFAYVSDISSGLHGNTAADGVRSRMARVACSQSKARVFARRRTKVESRTETARW
ncbi:hypothetical protein TNCV_4716131 [Trichonephila clavipes]|nr:hypothetical protein TNCV_4716131 [Trichonephila clavipes]